MPRCPARPCAPSTTARDGRQRLLLQQRRRPVRRRGRSAPPARERHQPARLDGVTGDGRPDAARVRQVEQDGGRQHAFAPLALQRGLGGGVVEQQQKEVFGDLRHERTVDQSGAVGASGVVRLRADQRRPRWCCRWARCSCACRRPWRRSARRRAASWASRPRACRRVTPSWRVRDQERLGVAVAVELDLDDRAGQRDAGLLGRLADLGVVEQLLQLADPGLLLALLLARRRGSRRSRGGRPLRDGR